MRRLTDFVCVIIYFAVLPCLETASLDVCQAKFGDDVVLHTSYKDGNRSCCKSIVCPAGFEAVLCSLNDPTSTSCRCCPPNTYQSHPTNSVDMKYCDAKTTCDVGMKTENDDSSIEDRRCLCDLEKGYCNPSRNRSMFCQRRSCVAGMELNQDCSCSECLYGYFKDVNGSMPCKLWRNCRDEGKKTVVQGSTTMDAECSAYGIPRRTLTVAKAMMSTISPGNVFTSESLAYSRELLPSTSDTALEIENSLNWNPVAIVTGIIAVLAVCVCVFVFVCHKYGSIQHMYTHFRPGQCITQSEVKLEPNTQQPTDPSAKAQNGVYSPGLEVSEPLLGGAHDPQIQQESCNGTERENTAVGRQTPELAVEDPYWPMTHAMTESLRTHQVDLLNSLVIDPVFLSLLNINNTITDEMRCAIQSESTPNSRIDKFLNYLRRRPCLSYKTFIFALVFTRQLHLAQKINAELAAEYKTYIESVEHPEEKVLSFGCL